MHNHRMANIITPCCPGVACIIVCVRVLAGTNQLSVMSLHVSPDGRFLAAGRIWDLTLTMNTRLSHPDYP